MSTQPPAKVVPTAPGGSTPDGPWVVRSFACLLSCIRFDEVLVLQGSPLLGAIVSMGRPTTERVFALLLLAAGSCCLVAHVFALNDWCGMHGDLLDPNRNAGVFVTKGIRRVQFGRLVAALLALSLLLLSPFGLRTMSAALAIATLSALYSASPFRMKGVPLVNSALHFMGGLLHFLLGYSIFSPIDARGLEIGTFFAVIFVGGHLNQEIRDRESDLLNGIRTNAVTFGKRRTFAASLVLFTIAYVLLIVMAGRGTVPRALALTAGLCPLHFYWSYRAVREGLTFQSIHLLQVRYRAIYATIGFIMAVMMLSR